MEPGRTHRLLANALRLITVERFELARDHDERYFEAGFEETRGSYIDRFEGQLTFDNLSVLDVGCGYGSSCFEIARRCGARRVVGIDVEQKFISFALEKLRSEYSDLIGSVDFLLVDPKGQDLDERFDLVFSKDSFEHIAPPESYLDVLKSYVKPNGTLAIGFGPLWNSPYGAHEKWMTWVPWVHLLSPEQVVMHEWQRLGFPDGATAYEEITGSLNRMTLRRFRRITSDPELEPVFFKTNQSTARSGMLLRALARVPGLGELCTFNVYTIWRCRPA